MPAMLRKARIDRRRHATTTAAESETGSFFRMPTRPRLGTAERAYWLRRLAIMLRAGVPLVAALENPAVATAARSTAGRAALQQVRREVEAGSSLSQALARRADMFDTFAVQIVVAGETSGHLDEALLRIAERTERGAALRSSVQRALIYPAIVLAIASVAVALLLLFVIPVFAEIFREFDAALPLPTLLVVAASEWAVEIAPFLLPALATGACGIAAWKRNPTGRAQLDALICRTPIIGPIVRASALSQAIETLAALVRSGIPVFEALRIAAGTAGNAELAAAFDTARRAVGAGQPLAAALAAGRHVPASTTAMIAIGEETGTLDTMLDNAASLARQDAENAIALLLSLLEPAIVLFLAVVVGGVVISMYLPIFRLGGVMT